MLCVLTIDRIWNFYDHCACARHVRAWFCTPSLRGMPTLKFLSPPRKILGWALLALESTNFQKFSLCFMVIFYVYFLDPIIKLLVSVIQWRGPHLSKKGVHKPAWGAMCNGTCHIFNLHQNARLKVSLF